MDFQVERISPIRKKLNFSIPADEVRAELDKAYKQLQRRARLPGFRPGKIPRPVLRRRFAGQVHSQVTNDLVQKAFQSEIVGMEYFGQPQVETEGVAEGSDFEFSFLIEVEPELDLSDYVGVEVSYPESSVDDAMVQGQIDARLRSRASLANVEEARPVQLGDDVLVRIVARAAAEEGAEAEVVHEALGAAVRVGNEAHYAGLDSHLVGKSADETFSAEITFGDDAGVAELAGQTLEVELEVLAIREMRAPELDDEVAADLGHESAEALRDDTRAKIQASLDAQNRNQARANLLRVLVDANGFDVPGALTDQYLEALMQELQIQHLQQGRDARSLQYSDAQMADLRSRALFAARSSLILKNVSEKEDLGVDDAELEAKIEEIATARGQRVEAIKGYLAAENATEELRARVLEEKTLDWLLDRAVRVEPAVAADVDDAAAADAGDAAEE